MNETLLNCEHDDFVEVVSNPGNVVVRMLLLTPGTTGRIIQLVDEKFICFNKLMQYNKQLQCPIIQDLPTCPSCLGLRLNSSRFTSITFRKINYEGTPIIDEPEPSRRLKLR